LANWVTKFTQKYGKTPGNYAVTGHDGALLVLDAIKRVANSGNPVNRCNLRAVRSTSLKCLQGVVSFDDNGDVKYRTLSLFPYKRDPKYPDAAQFDRSGEGRPWCTARAIRTCPAMCYPASAFAKCYARQMNFSFTARITNNADANDIVHLAGDAAGLRVRHRFRVHRALPR
jgi:hypothetical protein